MNDQSNFFHYHTLFLILHLKNKKFSDDRPKKEGVPGMQQKDERMRE